LRLDTVQLPENLGKGSRLSGRPDKAYSTGAVGFDPRQTAEGVGMRAMRGRTALLNGRLEVSSEPAGGTTVRLRMPRPS
jgi:hypothetical protein